MIHPTAIVHPSARIGEGTVIGPSVIIDADVEIGENCEIRAHAVLTGCTKIGDGNQIGYGVIIGAEPQDSAYAGAKTFVEIGNDNLIREYVTIHRGTKEGSSTKLGNNNFIMAGAHIAHNCVVGNHVTIVNNCLLAGYVQVHDRAFLGGAVVIHQFTRIGQLAMVRGQTRLGMDLPPFFMAVSTNTVCGLNRVGIRRNGYNLGQRKWIQRAYHLLYLEGKNRQQAVAAMSVEPESLSREVCLIRDFISSTARGICRSLQSKDLKQAEATEIE